MITVTVQWFSVLAEKRGKRSESVQLSENSSGEVLIEKLAKDFPVLKTFRPYLRLAVNQNYVKSDTILNHGDEIVFITPVSGG